MSEIAELHKAVEALRAEVAAMRIPGATEHSTPTWANIRDIEDKAKAIASKAAEPSEARIAQLERKLDKLFEQIAENNQNIIEAFQRTTANVDIVEGNAAKALRLVEDALASTSKQSANAAGEAKAIAASNVAASLENIRARIIAFARG